MFTPATLDRELDVALPLPADALGTGDTLDAAAPLDLIIEALEEAVNTEKLLAFSVGCSCCSGCSCSNCGSCYAQTA